MKRHSSKELFKKGLWDIGGALDEMNSPGEAPERNVIECVNWKVHKDGKSRIKRPGCDAFDAIYSFGSDAVRGIFDYRDSGGSAMCAVATDKKVFVYDPDVPDWTEVYSQAGAIGRAVKFVAFESGRPLVTGYDTNLSIEAATSHILGIVAPTSTCTVADEGTAGNPDGAYKYLITYQRSSNYPCESNPSDESLEVDVTTHKIDLTAIPTSSDSKVNARRIYRTTAGGAIFYWLADIADNTTTVYEDNIADGSLGDEVSYDRGPPPAADFIEIWDNRAWFAVSSENKVYFCNSGEAEEMADANFIQVKARESDNITGLKAFGDRLYVFKNKSKHIIEKVGTSSYVMTELKDNIGCDALGSVAVMQELMLWKSKYGIEVFNGYRQMRPIVSSFVQRTIDTINNTYLDKIYGTINEKETEYWLSIPTGAATEPNEIIVLDIEKGVISGIYDFHKDITALYNIRDGSENLVLISGSSDGNIYKHGDSYYDDDGTAISAKFRTPWIRINGGRDIWNILRRLFVKYVSPKDKDITLNIYSNFAATATVTITLSGVTLTGDVDIRNEIIRRVNVGVHGTNLCFEFINNDKIAGDCRVIGFDAYFKSKWWRHDITGE